MKNIFLHMKKTKHLLLGLIMFATAPSLQASPFDGLIQKVKKVAQSAYEKVKSLFGGASTKMIVTALNSLGFIKDLDQTQLDNLGSHIAGEWGKTLINNLHHFITQHPSLQHLLSLIQAAVNGNPAKMDDLLQDKKKSAWIMDTVQQGVKRLPDSVQNILHKLLKNPEVAEILTDDIPVVEEIVYEDTTKGSDKEPPSLLDDEDLILTNAPHNSDAMDIEEEALNKGNSLNIDAMDIEEDHSQNLLDL